MYLKDKTVIVTGGASGIGAAMASRFAAEGARVTVADLDVDAAKALADSFGGLGLACDVTLEPDIQTLVRTTEATFGPIDLFCSNAGLAMGEPSHAASAGNDVWTRLWEVHVMAHVYAARAVLPGMIERGSGYLLQMASAAGLLNQIGDAAYSTTKHAAVGFAESLAITHGRDGIRVSVICPQYVATPLLGYDDPKQASGTSGLLKPNDVAESVVEGIDRESFLILPHPDVARFIQFKSSDYDKWLNVMRDLRGRILDEVGTTRLSEMHSFV
ncbi:MAG: SDR family oxidoreductase [Silicimonas sp.]